MDTVVELRSVVKRFGGRTVVDQVSLAVPRGQLYSLLGPSGCGKTTILRLIAGFEMPDEGEVLIHGIRVNELPPHRRKVSTVFQSYALFPHLTVAGNIEFGLRRARVAEAEIRKRVARVLELVQLPGAGARYPQQLSGGEKQRVALARSIVLEPDVLLLDEPLAALDLKLRREMQIELKRLQRAVGITFLFVTHDQEEALTLSDALAVMTQGRIEQVGTPEEVYRRPGTQFVAGFIGSSNLIAGRITTVSAQEAEITTPGGRCVAARCGGSAAAGSSVRILVRPECVQIAEGPPPDNAQSLAGRVINTVFLGSHYQVQVEVEPGLEVTALMRAGNPPAAGTAVQVWWRTEDGTVVG